MSSSPTPPNPSWEARYEELLQWKAMHGDTCVPKAEGALGRWVARQRELKRSEKLDPRRESALNAIGFVWNTVTAMWEERFRRLSQWKHEHGHCAVPIAEGELGTWVSKQRQLRKRGKLTKQKIEALDSLGFTWSTAEADWEDKFKRLCQWAKERGHASVPFNEGELGWWVNTQRQCKRKGKLSPTREARLQSLGFIWNPSSSRNRAANANSAATAAPSTTGASSSDTTPRTTPDKAFPQTSPASDRMHIIALDPKDAQVAPLYPMYHQQHQLSQHQIYQRTTIQPTGADVTIAETPPQPFTEGPFSPGPVSLSHSLWSPTEIASPPMPHAFFQGLTAVNPSPVSFPLQLQPSVQQTFLPMNHATSMQTHSDALEQLLSRSDPGTDPDPQG